jgi:hypothetical protein
MYSRDNTNQGWTESSGFKDAFSNHVKIDFVGVWYVCSLWCVDVIVENSFVNRDTVSAVGFFPIKRLPFTRGTSHIRIFRHALSLDERRVYVPLNFL